MGPGFRRGDKNMITELAPAKINLYLHVLGKREDGYHRLDSLVVFVGKEAADKVTLTPASAYALRIEGREGEVLRHEDPEKNLVTKALRALSKKTGKPLNFSITLEKNLPVASGIGGGSADAAAALRVAAKFWKIEHGDALFEAARETGADVYPCLLSEPGYLEGIGHEFAAAPALPPFWMVLVNPNIPLPTQDVFKARKGSFSPAARLEKAPEDVVELVAMLKTRRNDLQPPAIELCEAIENVLEMIAAQPGCGLARMSGSGATCFGIFEDEKTAARAAQHIRHQIREYWVAATVIGNRKSEVRSQK